MASGALFVSSLLPLLVSNQLFKELARTILTKTCKSKRLLGVRCFSSNNAAAQTNQDLACPFQSSLHKKLNSSNSLRSPKLIKSFECIPRPKGLPLIGTALSVLAKGGAPKVHEYCDSKHRELGPVFRDKLGPVSCVFLADSKMISKVYQNEGKYPSF